MAERKENSVLFSLNELRSIEEERQQEAVDAKRKAEEDRIRTQMESERRTREDAEARQRAIDDAERAERQAVEHSAREERIRIEEGERRARVEAQAQLEQQRMHQEMQIRVMEVQKKRPTGLIALAVVLVLAVGGLAVFLVKRSNEKEAAERAAKMLAADIDTKSQELDRLVAEQNEIIDELRTANDEAARKRAEEKLAAKQADIKAKQEALKNLKTRGSNGPRGGSRDDDKPKDTGVKIKCDPNDPLCGI